MSKNIPIIFRSESIIAIMNRIKTQARKIVSPRPDGITADGTPYILRNADLATEMFYKSIATYVSERDKPFAKIIKSKYSVGDTLLVKETIYNRDGYACYLVDGKRVSTGAKWRWYKVEKLNAMYMPLVYRRFELKITEVFAHYLNSITEEDAISEGWNWQGLDLSEIDKLYPSKTNRARLWYMKLWDNINGFRGYPWSSNPAVWKIRFDIKDTYDS
jgi:hypothetical protein